MQLPTEIAIFEHPLDDPSLTLPPENRDSMYDGPPQSVKQLNLLGMLGIHPARNYYDAIALADHNIELTLSSLTYNTTVEGNTVELAPREFGIAYLLGRHADAWVRTEAILHTFWQHNDIAARRSLRVHISNLRTRLGEVHGDPRSGVIRSKRDLGYMALRSYYHPQAD